MSSPALPSSDLPSIPNLTGKISRKLGRVRPTLSWVKDQCSFRHVHDATEMKHLRDSGVPSDDDDVALAPPVEEPLSIASDDVLQVQTQEPESAAGAAAQEALAPLSDIDRVGQEMIREIKSKYPPPPNSLGLPAPIRAAFAELKPVESIADPSLSYVVDGAMEVANHSVIVDADEVAVKVTGASGGKDEVLTRGKPREILLKHSHGSSSIIEHLETWSGPMLTHGATVLQLGASRDYGAHELALQHSCLVTLVEPSPERAQIARDDAKEANVDGLVRVVEQDVVDFHITGKEYDLCISTVVSGELTPDQKEQQVSSAYGNLREGGEFICLEVVSTSMGTGRMKEKEFTCIKSLCGWSIIHQAGGGAITHLRVRLKCTKCGFYASENVTELIFLHQDDHTVAGVERPGDKFMADGRPSEREPQEMKEEWLVAHATEAFEPELIEMGHLVRPGPERMATGSPNSLSQWDMGNWLGLTRLGVAPSTHTGRDGGSEVKGERFPFMALRSRKQGREALKSQLLDMLRRNRK
ncbi:unnamed protein product [Chrysoparadoxa australica]